jgi:hypothetical protein
MSSRADSIYAATAFQAVFPRPFHRRPERSRSWSERGHLVLLPLSILANALALFAIFRILT